jgi:arylsulfatase A-like enzyme
MNAICLAVDRLHLGCLGAYGNSWIQTPAIDRLASEAFVFDQAWIDTSQLEDLYRSYWHGLHAFAPAAPAGRPSLATLLREAGVTSALLSDDRLVTQHPLTLDFDELVEIDPPRQPQTAGEVEQTHLAQCFVQAIDWLQSARGPFLLWCHLKGLATTWDAPLDYRGAYWDEGDPEPSTSADVPDKTLPPGCDPDDVLGMAQAYCGQVSLLDTCLDALLEFLQTSPAGQETLLILTSTRGYPLGEHGRIGPCDEALYSELVHVPLLVRIPNLVGAAIRSPALVEPSDLWATLLDWWSIAPRPAAPTAGSLLPIIRQEAAGGVLRDRLGIAGPGAQRAICTPAWYLRNTTDAELFVKPDDRWDVNNVAVRCQDVVECLLIAMEQYEQAVRTGTVAELPPLNEVLLSGLD